MSRSASPPFQTEYHMIVIGRVDFVGRSHQRLAKRVRAQNRLTLGTTSRASTGDPS